MPVPEVERENASEEERERREERKRRKSLYSFDGSLSPLFLTDRLFRPQLTPFRPPKK